MQVRILRYKSYQKSFPRNVSLFVHRFHRRFRHRLTLQKTNQYHPDRSFPYPVGITIKCANNYRSQHRMRDTALLRMGRVGSCTRRVAKVLGIKQGLRQPGNAQVKNTSSH